jgi:hypothetical protein
MEETIEKDTPTTETKTDVVENQPDKKSGGCLKGFLIVFAIFLFVLILLAVGGYIGYRKIVKGMEQQDFGITYSEQDYIGLMEEIGIDADPTVLCIDCPTPSFSEPQDVNITVSNKQASAAFEYINKYLTYGSVSNTQIRISNNQAELSTIFTYQGRDFPVYMKGDIAKASENSINGNISELKVGSLELPSGLSTFVESTLLGIANDKIAAAGDTIKIDKLKLEEGKVNFEGVVPSKIE